MKRLVFCFDGTWNKLDAPHPTNVVITAETVIPTTKEGIAQLIYYDEGVGTGKYETLSGGLFGTGLVKNLGDAYRFLIFNYMPGDEIYVFGFSRGAYSARSFVGLLRSCGIIRRRDAAKVNEAIELYRSRESDTALLAQQRACFRRDFSPDVCISVEDVEWRVANAPDFVRGASLLLSIKYLGVWDTVGSLGIPERYKILSFINKKHRFHDTKLSDFVERAWHAVGVDELRLDFKPTLWDNIEDLNHAVGAKIDAEDAPYQQKWFPGVHGAIGGGGDRRGLSDQALDWILDGARHAGLVLDGTKSSRIFELAPSHTDNLQNTTPVSTPTLLARGLNAIMSLMPLNERMPGPSKLHEVSVSAIRRWLESPQNLPAGRPYRPKTLEGIAPQLNALSPEAYGVGPNVQASPNDKDFVLHEVKPGDQLRTLAKHYYGDPNLWALILKANINKIVNPDRIYVGMILRIPTNPKTG